MAPRRLLPSDSGPSPNPARVRFTFDGRTYDGVEGEPLAVSLFAADRLILSRSFRFHRPRGLMCNTGQCGWCECEVDGRPSVRSCRVPLRDGLVALGEHAWPSVDRDLFGWLDLAARWIPPTFYHHRFLRPRALRKWYLDVLRWFGGRGRLRVGGVSSADPGRVTRSLDVGVLVVGGGPAGLAAAEGAAAEGAAVALLESVAEGRGVDAVGVRVHTATTAVGWYDGVVTAVGPETHWTIRAGVVVAATGSYERVPAVRGADRPGVIGARLALELIERYAIVPGDRPLLVGSGSDLADLTAVRAALVAAGAKPVGPIPPASLRRILGRRRVTGAIVANGGRERRVSVDLVVFSARTPNLDLVLAAGAAVNMRDDVVSPVVDDVGRTTVPRLVVVGSAAGWPTSGSEGPARARAAGAAAAAAVLGGLGPAHTDESESSPAITVAPVTGRALVCFCEDVHVDEIRAQCAAGYADPELVKRRTGALTGPCQGKYCRQGFVAAMAGVAPLDLGLPTGRPPLRPIRLGDLVPAGGSGTSDLDDAT